MFFKSSSTLSHLQSVVDYFIVEYFLFYFERDRERNQLKLGETLLNTKPTEYITSLFSHSKQN